MARNKDMEKKRFLSAARKKRGPSITNAPFWVVRKKGKRVYNTKQKRHWRSTELGAEFIKAQKKQGTKVVKGRAHYAKSKHNRSRHKRKIKKVR